MGIEPELIRSGGSTEPLTLSVDPAPAFRVGDVVLRDESSAASGRNFWREWATLLSMPGLVIRIAWALISWPVMLLLGLRKPDTYDAR